MVRVLAKSRLRGAGVALYAVQPGVYVRMTRPLLLDKGLELDRELKQFLAQDACSDSLPPGWVGVEGSEEVVEGVDGRHGGDYTLFPAHWSALSVVAVCLAAALRMASLRLRDCRWASAQVGSILWVKRVGLAVRLCFSPDVAGRRCAAFWGTGYLGLFEAGARRESRPGGNRLGPC